MLVAFGPGHEAGRGNTRSPGARRARFAKSCARRGRNDKGARPEIAFFDSQQWVGRSAGREHPWAAPHCALELDRAE